MSAIISGAIATTGDQDLFRMTLTTAQIVRMETFDSCCVLSTAATPETCLGGIYYLRVEPHTPGSASAAMQFDYQLVVTVR